jgi:hypothetical protein
MCWWRSTHRHRLRVLRIYRHTDTSTQLLYVTTVHQTDWGHLLPLCQVRGVSCSKHQVPTGCSLRTAQLKDRMHDDAGQMCAQRPAHKATLATIPPPNRRVSLCCSRASTGCPGRSNSYQRSYCSQRVRPNLLTHRFRPLVAQGPCYTNHWFKSLPSPVPQL